MEFRIFVPGRPRPKERPRAAVGSKSGKAFMYTPATTLNTENMIREKATKWMEEHEMLTPHEGPVHLSVLNLYAAPKTWWEGREPMGGKGDVDNLMKVAMDAMNRVLFKDDSQIIKATSEKRYFRQEGVLIVAYLFPLIEKPKMRMGRKPKNG